MFQIRSHTHHVDIHRFQKKQIVGQISGRLKRKSDHHSCTGLVTATLKAADTFQPGVKIMELAGRMKKTQSYGG